ncbi:DNA mismatch repair endonuclease MutL [Cognaticolwellia mytili]|uniref:DNA mismatch repair endonuclease MutL n=1 Tax=Cognaticolwellia mytili TaxID=1888913 RepID=UPI000A173038|nr:DNA mismatch repair endonuclease MutL [Cognaticolwellia mytili]
MTIAILPARLANQIAAGEVVERPSSVVKELVENSLDAGATSIRIDIEKGGAKRIRIVDNGKGIAKDELGLALSRHATSKIKDLDDLEAISSLGFRGEALASISSVSRLTLTSKPQAQTSAWQANAEGRDMAVAVNPAAHPDGTTIDVIDLFFNTPARRKFLRTEKTEFGHIEEVIKRIALARFDVAFVLTHNHKVIKQFRIANSAAQRSKRVAQICSQKFIDNALEVDCQHDGFHIHGWIAQPSFYRSQNDLTYSYVNGRMMRDKLINHAIRQAYAELLPNDSYPAFVLFLKLDFREVDVNVHPAKHEVRFHQGRYVHDFIYSVCHQALISAREPELAIDDSTGEIIPANNNAFHPSTASSVDTSFVTPLRTETRASSESSAVQAYTRSEPQVSPSDSVSSEQSSIRQHSTRQYSPAATHSYTSKVSEQASKAYSDLMTPLVDTEQARENPVISDAVVAVNPVPDNQLVSDEEVKILHWLEPHYLVFEQQQELRLLSVKKIDLLIKLQTVKQRWHEKLICQPLLLPIKITVGEKAADFVEINTEQFQHVGMEIRRLNKTTLQIRQFPALLRNQDVTHTFNRLIKQLQAETDNEVHSEIEWQMALAELMVQEEMSQEQALQIWRKAKKQFNYQFEQQLRLNSVAIDLTSSISQLA